ncbi:hypothetical protein [uncultured Clostridium sp.]|uniref:hypothetical protein n=1 Tax=uncultured Clostridium sp. TaxID=59620 RepID=UPI00261E9C48|nr:hypothetical protein [uncultured Clostridium sp.]
MQVSVDEMLRPDEQPKQGGSNTKNSYFSLANDGDSAIVRFLQTDINDFEVLDVHNIKVAGYNRKINCLRSQNGSKDECAICTANVWDEETGRSTYPLQRKFYIHLLRYENPQTATEQVWERSKDFIKKLNQFAVDYGPLYDRIYKIVRHGAAGSMDTTYDILPLDKDRYNPAQFVFDKSQLNYKKALGTIVLNESNEGMQQFLSTGNFPGFNNQKKEQVSTRPTNNQTNMQATQMSFDNLNSPRNVTFNNSNTNNNFSFDAPRRRV